MITYRTPTVTAITPYLHTLNEYYHHPLKKVAISHDFKPTDLLDIFENGRQIRVVERTLNKAISDYLAFASPKLGNGFHCVIKANECVSARLIKENSLPNHANRDAFLADIDLI